jgi:hypothetical protein
MNNTLRSTLLVLATVAALPAQAAIQNWNFSGTLESGAYAGATFSGTARFDDAVLTGIGEEWIALDAINLTFLGQSYSTIDAAAVPGSSVCRWCIRGSGLRGRSRGSEVCADRRFCIPCRCLLCL